MACILISKLVKINLFESVFVDSKMTGIDHCKRRMTQAICWSFLCFYVQFFKILKICE
jgi:hypothetical protein